MIEEHDHRPIRCPRLGGKVNFKCFRIMNDRLPSRWIIGCWQMYIDMNRFLADYYSKDELDRVFAPPKPKVESLVELIEKSKRVNKGR
jgi:hypothetical protein